MKLEVPGEDQLFYPIYDLLSDMKSHHIKDIIKMMALHFPLNEEKQKRFIDAPKHLFENGVEIISFDQRVGQVLMYLDSIGYSSLAAGERISINITYDYEIKLNSVGLDFFEKNKHLSEKAFKAEFDRLKKAKKNRTTCNNGPQINKSSSGPTLKLIAFQNNKISSFRPNCSPFKHGIVKLNSLSLGSNISSASSLININGRVFVCGDDQYEIDELQKDEWIKYTWDKAPYLPEEKKARKKLKPDFEILLRSFYNDKDILLVPSGSKSNRFQALKFNLINKSFVTIDMSEFFHKLSEKVSLINLEGAAIYDKNYLFMNRGINDDLSSIISVNPKTFNINKISKIDFGSIKGTKLHGSELCIFENHLFALATAEASPNSYDDGEVLGSAIFKLSLDKLKVLDKWKFDRPIKAEGLCRWNDKWLIATDPDGVGESEFFSFDLAHQAPYPSENGLPRHKIK